MSRKCSQCGLVNFASAVQCRRCGAAFDDAAFDDAEQFETLPDEGVEQKKRSLAQRLMWIFGMTAVILFICYASLLLTSDPIGWEQRQLVSRAIDVLESKGFGSEVFVLRHLVSYRATDNWWNMQIGHHDAYASTNFPFEVVTLYPEFFEKAADDTERAAILLHESYHLFGAGEPAALEGVWRSKSRLGWTPEQYGETKVWKNTRELTVNQVPKLFSCGDDSKSDCTE
jgi:hypothetical protein